MNSEEAQGLQAQIDELRELITHNDFSARQIFDKIVKANRFQLKKYSSNPTSAQEGELMYVGGKLVICTVGSTTAPTFVVVGTQT